MIENSTNRIIFKGDGKTKEFPYKFKILRRSDVVVVIEKNKKETILRTDYFVDMDKKVIFYPGYAPGEEPSEANRPPLLAPGENIIIYRSIPITQDATFGNKWPFGVIEKAFDKITMILQDLWDNWSLSLQLPKGLKDTSTELPYPEANKAIGWNEDGKALKNIPVSTTTAADAVRAENARVGAEAAEMNSEKNKDIAVLSKEEAGGYAEQALNYSKIARSIAESKVMAWNDSSTYNYPDVIAFTDGYTYRCIGNSITGESPAEMRNWVRITTKGDDFWDIDTEGNIMPAVSPLRSDQFQLDGNGDIMPV